MNKKIFVIALLAVLASPLAVFAAGDNIRVVPVGSSSTGMAIITGNPSNLEMFVTSGQQDRTNAWLLIVLDKDTYDGLNSITLTGTDGPTTVAKAKFSGAVNSGKIPLQTGEGNFTGDGKTYPGCTKTTQYSVGAILSQMSQVTPTTEVHYCLVYAFDTITTTPKPFTVNIDSTHINALILAQGASPSTTGPLDSNSPFSGSTLQTPELASILMALASFSAFGIYMLRRRKK